MNDWLWIVLVLAATGLLVLLFPVAASVDIIIAYPLILIWVAFGLWCGSHIKKRKRA